MAQARGSDLSSCEAVLTQKLKSLELQNTLPGQADLASHKSLALDPSCLLTPPNTPQGSELAEADMREAARQQHRGRTTRTESGQSENLFSLKFWPSGPAYMLFASLPRQPGPRSAQ